MNKFDEALKDINKARVHDDDPEYHIWMPRTKSLQTIRTALTQAAEIERGDKVVVPREPTYEMLKASWDYSYHPVCEKSIYKAMITASEGKDDE